jgi:hypothetical protein
MSIAHSTGGLTISLIHRSGVGVAYSDANAVANTNTITNTAALDANARS